MFWGNYIKSCLEIPSTITKGLLVAWFQTESFNQTRIVANHENTPQCVTTRICEQILKILNSRWIVYTGILILNNNFLNILVLLEDAYKFQLPQAQQSRNVSFSLHLNNLLVSEPL